MEATETKRRIPRKRVRLVKVMVDGVEVDGKECTKCGVVKALTEYTVEKLGFGGKRSNCRECESERQRKYYEDNTEKARERNRNYRETNSEKALEANRKYREDNPEYARRHYENNSERYHEQSRKWHEDNREKARELNRKWNEDNPDIRREYDRKWAEANPDKVRARGRKWREGNPDKISANNRRRAAMRRALPSTWTVAEDSAMYECALTLSTGDIHADHVIPLAWGHGGSYVGNMVPLSAALNISKNDTHVYEWFETNRQRFELDRTRFDRMISIVAAQNGLTPDEYRQYYDWCYENRRTVAQTKRDNAEYGDKRPSLDIWREASGIPFPVRIDFGEKAETKRRVRTRKESEVTA